MNKLMLNPVLCLLLFTLAKGAAGQCPTVQAAMINGCGTPEGPNEFVVVNTGAMGVSITDVAIEYALSSVSWRVTGSTSGIWVPKSGSGNITNSAGTVTTVSSGAVPAGKPWVILPATLAVDYNLATFGGDVYVSYYDPTKAYSYSNMGNFSNSGGGTRSFTLTATGCSNVVSYAPNSLSGSDGAGVAWSIAGIAKYVNTGCAGAVLPIGLEAFRGWEAGNGIKLQWQLHNVADYERIAVERSNDGRTFLNLGNVPIQQGIWDYHFEDDNAQPAGMLAYRLQLSGKDGRTAYSNVLVVKANATGGSKLYLSPNPASDHLSVQLSSDQESECRIQIFQSTGKLVADEKRTLHQGSNNVVIPVTELPSGVYFIRVGAGNALLQERWLKQ